MTVGHDDCSAWDVKELYKELASENIALLAATNVGSIKIK
jgi:hypothetical protein